MILVLEDLVKLKRIIKRLNGKKNLIFGNHCNRYEKYYLKSGLFQSCQDYQQIKYEDQKIILFHYPILKWNACHYQSWHLNGHSHGNILFDPSIKRLDVGVDTRQDFSPYEFEEIKVIFDNPTDFQYYKHTNKLS